MTRPNVALFIAKAVATGGGSGLAPRAPGTIGTAAAVAVWCLVRFSFPAATVAQPWFLPLCAIVLGLLASQMCINDEARRGRNAKDPQYIVIDEWAGVFIALEAAPTPTPFSILTAFVLFRLFDISKPGPIRALEKLPGGLGVMMDDIAAGTAAFIIQLLYYLYVK